MQKSGYIWINGKFVHWNEAIVPIQTHTLHYGLGIFEGIRCYKTDKGPGIFRLTEHLNRFYKSAQIAGIEIPFKQPELHKAIIETIKINKLEECYIRPLAFVGAGRMGLNPIGLPIHMAIMVWPWGAYLGEDGIKNGVRTMISSYAKQLGHHELAKAKITGGYVNSQMAKMEAVRQGCDEAIMLDPNGNIAEGSGENIFVTHKGHITTPTKNYILEGITRDTVITLAKKRGWNVTEKDFKKEFLFSADEIFFTGTAAEVTPIREIDRNKIGDGKPGPITKALQQDYQNVVYNKGDSFSDWLTFPNLI